jgi:hypothetical protein
VERERETGYGGNLGAYDRIMGKKEGGGNNITHIRKGGIEAILREKMI